MKPAGRLQTITVIKKGNAPAKNKPEAEKLALPKTSIGENVREWIAEHRRQKERELEYARRVLRCKIV